MIGYKLLTPDLCSMFAGCGIGRSKALGVTIQYSLDWMRVPGIGAYVADKLPALLSSGFQAPTVLATVEYDLPAVALNIGHGCSLGQRVRILGYDPVTVWHLVCAAIYAAQLALRPGDMASLAAIEAAKRCERERTPEAAAAAALAAGSAAGAAAGAARSARAAQESMAYVPDSRVIATPTSEHFLSEAAGWVAYAATQATTMCAVGSEIMDRFVHDVGRRAA